MKLHTFQFLDQHKHGPAFATFLKLRQQILVDSLGWSLPNDGQYEMDQYDRVDAFYSIVTNDSGDAIAGARAAPCNASWGGWSYMLNDAAKGLIPEIPSDLMEHYPQTADTWECTRFVSSQPEDSTATKLVVSGLCQIAAAHGAKELISLSPPRLLRLLQSYGYKVQRAGKTYLCDDDQKRYIPLKMHTAAGNLPLFT